MFQFLKMSRISGEKPGAMTPLGDCSKVSGSGRALGGCLNCRKCKAADARLGAGVYDMVSPLCWGLPFIKFRTVGQE